MIALHTLFRVASSVLCVCVCVGGLVEQPAASESVFLKDERYNPFPIIVTADSLLLRLWHDIDRVHILHPNDIPEVVVVVVVG